jgi:hypothetical protein
VAGGQHDIAATRRQDRAGARGSTDRGTFGGSTATANDSTDHRPDACTSANLGCIFALRCLAFEADDARPRLIALTVHLNLGESKCEM